jgi:hypothetical protein
MVSPINQQIRQNRNTNAFFINGGRESVLKYPVMAGYDAFIIDEENKMFYIKTNDINGQNISLREFKYEEVTPQEQQPQQDSSKYATKEDLAAIMAEIKKLQNNRGEFREYHRNNYNHRRNRDGKQYDK